MPPCTWIAALAFATDASSASSLAAATADAAAGSAGDAVGGFVGEQHRRRVHGGAGQLGAREHVRAQVLDRLERADGPAELRALLGVGDRALGQHRGDAHLVGGGQQRAFAQQRVGGVGVADDLAAQRLLAQAVERDAGIHRVGNRIGAQLDRLDAQHLAVPRDAGSIAFDDLDDQQRVERVQVLQDLRSPPVRSPNPTRCRPPAYSGSSGAASAVAVKGPVARERPSSSKTCTDSGCPRPRPPSASGTPHAEDAQLGEVAPQRDVHAADAGLGTVFARRPRRGVLAQHVAHRAGQRLLVLCRPEVHYRPPPFVAPAAEGSLGRPRMRSPMMLRWTCEVPAAIVYARDLRRS